MHLSKKILVILIIISSFTTTSCWNSRELNELAFVTAIAIDMGPEPQTINLTCQIFVPAEIQGGSGQAESSTGSSKPYYNATASGLTVFEAIRKISQQIDRRLYFPHLQVLIFSEDIAKTGLSQYLDLMNRDPEFRRSSYLVICQGKAMDILDAQTHLMPIPGDSFQQIIDQRVNASLAIGITLLDFSKRLMAESTAPLASYLEFNQTDKTVRLTGAATFNKDTLSGILNEDETRGLLWILNKIKAGISVVSCPNPSCPKPDGKVSLELVPSKSKLKPEIEDGKPQFQLDIRPHAHLSEQTCPCDLSTPDMIDSLKKLLSQEITQKVNLTLKKAQEHNCDIMGFGEKIKQKYPRYWRENAQEWEEDFPLVPVNIKIEVLLDVTGMNVKPLRSLQK